MIVAIGGGTGLFTVLQGLKKYTNNIAAIVTMADHGGSSGILRDELGVLPPGDIRRCLVALSESRKLMADLFEYRFKKGSLKGHSFGNLLITALTEITGSFDKAIKECSKILAVKGIVIPCTFQDIKLCALLENGKIIKGEPAIESFRLYHNVNIKKLFLEPRNVKANKEAINTIKNAEKIILGPGSLYTSIIPNLLIKNIKNAIVKSKAKKIYVVNIMTQHGETDNFTANMHVSEIIKYLSKDILDYVIVNTEIPSAKVLKAYAEEWKFPVKVDKIKTKAKIVRKKLLRKTNFARHDPDKLAKTILALK